VKKGLSQRALFSIMDSAQVTEIYAEVDLSKAAEVMAEMG